MTPSAIKKFAMLGCITPIFANFDSGTRDFPGSGRDRRRGPRPRLSRSHAARSSPHLSNERCAYVKPHCRFTTADTCSTFACTFDFVRFLRFASSSTQPFDPGRSVRRNGPASGRPPVNLPCMGEGTPPTSNLRADCDSVRRQTHPRVDISKASSSKAAAVTSAPAPGPWISNGCRR
jgi:hypothetical protein